MPKSRDKEGDQEKVKLKEEKSREPKKSHRALVRRVKKVVKRSRRKLGDEKFEKELQRTITFLARLQGKLDRAEKPATKQPARKAKAGPPAKAAAKTVAKPRPKAPAKAAAKPTARPHRASTRKN